MIPLSYFGDKQICIDKKNIQLTDLEIAQGKKSKYKYIIPFLNCIEYQNLTDMLRRFILNNDIDTKYKEIIKDDLLSFTKIKKEHKDLVLKNLIDINTHTSEIPSLKEQQRTFGFDIESFVSIAHFIAQKDNDTSVNVLKRPYVQVMHLLDILMLSMLKEEYNNNLYYLSMDNTKTQNETEKLEKLGKIRDRQSELNIILKTVDEARELAKIKADTEEYKRG